jgi:hypothetical protein
MSADGVINCPNEYGPGIGVVDGIYRKIYGECICAHHGETPCRYLNREDGQLAEQNLLSDLRLDDDTP